jgi:hypothetical protein
VVQILFCNESQLGLAAAAAAAILHFVHATAAESTADERGGRRVIVA